MRSITYLTAILLFLATTSCVTTYTFKSQAARSIELANYRSFQVSSLEATPTISPASFELVDQAIRNELLTLGYRPQAQADLVVNWQLSLEQKTDISNAYQFARKWRLSEAGAVYDYQTTTLTIELVDTGNRALIWQGKIAGLPAAFPHESPQSVDRLIRSLFNKFRADFHLPVATIAR